MLQILVYLQLYSFVQITSRSALILTSWVYLWGRERVLEGRDFSLERMIYFVTKFSKSWLQITKVGVLILNLVQLLFVKNSDRP